MSSILISTNSYDPIEYFIYSNFSNDTRYLGHCKSYVRNKAQPEGSIAESYLAEEILTFCSRYLNDIETRFNRPSRNDDNFSHESSKKGLFPLIGRSVGGISDFELTPIEKLQAHRCVLFNCSAIEDLVQ